MIFQQVKTARFTVRGLARLLVVLAGLLSMAPQTPGVQASETVSLGIIPGPVGSGVNRGTYVDLEVNLQLAEGVSRLAIYRHITKLRDAIMVSLHNHPLTHGADGGGLDFGAAESTALEAVGRVVGERAITRVSVERMRIEDLCDGSTSVRRWRKKCD
jgi:hypothetical protein